MYKNVVILKLIIFKLVVATLVINLLKIVFSLFIYVFTYFFDSEKCRNALHESKDFIVSEYKNFINFLKQVLFVILNCKLYVNRTVCVIINVILNVINFILQVFLNIASVFYYLFSYNFLYDMYRLVLFSCIYILLFNIYLYLFLVQLVCFVCAGFVLLRFFIFIFALLFSTFGIYLKFKLYKTIKYFFCLKLFGQFLIFVYTDIAYGFYPKIGALITQVLYYCDYLDDKTRVLSSADQEAWYWFCQVFNYEGFLYFYKVWTIEYLAFFFWLLGIQ